MRANLRLLLFFVLWLKSHISRINSDGVDGCEDRIIADTAAQRNVFFDRPGSKSPNRCCLKMRSSMLRRCCSWLIRSLKPIWRIGTQHISRQLNNFQRAKSYYHQRKKSYSDYIPSFPFRLKWVLWVQVWRRRWNGRFGRVCLEGGILRRSFLVRFHKSRWDILW